MLETVNCF